MFYSSILTRFNRRRFWRVKIFIASDIMDTTIGRLNPFLSAGELLIFGKRTKRRAKNRLYRGIFRRDRTICIGERSSRRGITREYRDFNKSEISIARTKQENCARQMLKFLISEREKKTNDRTRTWKTASKVERRFFLLQNILEH